MAFVTFPVSVFPLGGLSRSGASPLRGPFELGPARGRSRGMRLVAARRRRGWWIASSSGVDDGVGRGEGQKTVMEREEEEVVAGPFRGHFGEWNLTVGDVREVLQYRTGMAMGAACAAIGAGMGLGLGMGMEVRWWMLDGLYVGWVLSMALSLSRVHIYMRVMHDMLKVLMGVGVAGAGILAAMHGGHVVETVLARPEMMTLVGWQFVALTGLFFKEAFCFGRLEAVLLTLLVPFLSAGHFLQAFSTDLQVVSTTAFALLYIVFAIRKFQQLPQDDLGDKSVFDYLAANGGKLP